MARKVCEKKLYTEILNILKKLATNSRMFLYTYLVFSTYLFVHSWQKN